MSTNRYGRRERLTDAPCHYRHHSSGEASTALSHNAKTAYASLQPIMQQGNQADLLKPKTLRDQVRNLAQISTSHYKN